MRYQNHMFSFYETEFTPLYHTYSEEHQHIKVQCEDFIKHGKLQGQNESCDFIWFDIDRENGWVVCQLNELVRFPIKDYPRLERLVNWNQNPDKQINKEPA